MSPAVLRRTRLHQAARVLHGCLIVAAAWAAAAVVVRALSLDLDPRVPSLPAAEESATADRKQRRGADDDAVILRRNLFGVGDLEVADQEGPAATGGGDLRLRGIATTDGRAFAVFENVASGEQNVFAVGDKVFDGPKLVAVDATGADVMVRGRKKRYEIEDDDATASAGAGEGRRGKGEPRAAPDKSSTDKSKKSGADGVRKTGDNAYLVDRREVEHVVANLNEVITQARAVPVMEGGKSAGFKLFNIRQGSIFQKLGLHDGDIVQRVNDTELTDPSRAVGLLEEIQSMQQIKVNFVRGGRLQTHTYTIR